VAQWTRLEVCDTSEIEALADGVSSVLEDVANFFDAVAKVLDLLADIAIDEFDPIKALLLEVIAALEATITDVLQNNAYMAVHVNLNWDRTWRYDNKGTLYVPNTKVLRPDYKHDSKLPWAGNGLGGWLDDLNGSAYDKTQFFRPVTDADTSVKGLIFVVGATSADELATLKPLVETFLSGWKDLHKLFDIKEALDSYGDQWKALKKMGSAIGDESMRDLVAAEETVLGYADPSKYLPTPGNFPVWASVPISQLIPPLHGIFMLLEKFIAQIKPAGGFSDILSTLASMLAQKAETLSSIAEELATLVQSLTDLITLLNNGYFLWVESENGGFASWVDAIRAADLVMDGDTVVGPDFGTTGIVAGMVGVVTEDDPANHLQTLVRMITGFSFEDQATTQAQNLEDTYNSEFPPE